MGSWFTVYIVVGSHEILKESLLVLLERSYLRLRTLPAR